MMKSIPSKSVDLVFADPPYNLQLNGGIMSLNRPQGGLVEGVNDDWDKFNSMSDYDDFTRAWLLECRRILKPDGAIWVSGTYHNIFRVGRELQDLGFWILNDIIWVKNNPMPNFLGVRFCASHETFIWASRGRNEKFTFNYQAMKALNGDSQMRSDWHIPSCSGKERIKDKDGKKTHSTQKPEALLYRIILATTNIGDVILDPFFGTGTTGAIAKLLSRKYIGIERDLDYISVAEERIKKVIPLETEDVKNVEGEKKLEIPFGKLLEKRMLKIGTFLYSSDGQKKARILPNGNIRFKRNIGSIHKIACFASGLGGMNGWKYWRIKFDKVFYEIDLLREIYFAVTEMKEDEVTEKSYPINLYKLSKKGSFLSERELEKLKSIILQEYEHLNREEKRKYAFRQAEIIGWGGQSFVSDFLGMSRVTIRKEK